MARRNRLPKNATRKKTKRLPLAIARGVRAMSDKELRGMATAKISLRKVDPILDAYAMASKQELQRRKQLAKKWGEVPPTPAPAWAVGITKRAEQLRQAVRTFVRFQINVLKGKFVEDIEKATDYMIEKFDEYRKRGAKAKERWLSFWKAHGVLRKTETDYLKEGWDVEARFGVNVKKSLLKAHVTRQRKRGRKAIIVPTKSEGRMYYSILVL